MGYLKMLFVIACFITACSNTEHPPTLNSDFFIGSWQLHMPPDENIDIALFVFEDNKNFKFGHSLSSDGIIYSSSFEWAYNDVDTSFTIFNPNTKYNITSFKRDEIRFIDDYSTKLYIIIRE